MCACIYVYVFGCVFVCVPDPGSPAGHHVAHAWPPHGLPLLALPAGRSGGLPGRGSAVPGLGLALGQPAIGPGESWLLPPPWHAATIPSSSHTDSMPVSSTWAHPLTSGRLFRG